MVVLRNIKKTGNNIETDYYPEGGNEKFHMVLNISDGSIVEHNGNEFSMSPAHVKRELLRLSKTETLPKEKTLLWY